MRRLVVKIGVALLTFSAGVVLNNVITTLEDESKRSVSDQEISIEDQWHRLYEAAAMSDDKSGALREVSNRLLCTNRKGLADAVYIEDNGHILCRRDDGSLHQAGWGDYGLFYHQIKDSHYDWSINNVNFLRTISSVEKARRYVRNHRRFLMP
jgi:hypothetical protein